MTSNSNMRNAADSSRTPVSETEPPIDDICRAEQGDLPPDESIDLISIWVMECYTRPMITKLIERLKASPWESAPDVLMGLRQSPSEYVSTHRGTTPPLGYLMLTPLYPSDGEGPIFGGARADLPNGVQHVNARLSLFAPGLFMLLVQFFVDNSFGRDITKGLSRTFSERERQYEFSSGTGTIWDSPASQRREYQDDLKIRRLRSMWNWLEGTCPGVFSADEPPSFLPTVEVITLTKANLVEDQRPMPEYLSNLRFNWFMDRIGVEFASGLVLMLPSSETSMPRSITLATNVGVIESSGVIHPMYGEGRFALQSYISQRAEIGFIWTSSCLVSLLSDRISELQARAVEPVEELTSEQSLKLSLSLQESLNRFSGDFTDALTEFEDLLQSTWGRYIFSSVPLIRHTFSIGSNIDVRSKLKPLRNPLNILSAPFRNRSRMEPTTNPLSDKSGKLEGFGEDVRLGLISDLSRARSKEYVLRQHLNSITSLLATRSEQQATKANLTLQRLVLLLSILVIALTVVQVGLTLIGFTNFHINILPHWSPILESTPAP